MSIVFVGGGTGGHLTPGLCVAEELLRRSPDFEIAFVGGSNELERTMVESRGFAFHALPTMRLPKSAMDTIDCLRRSAGGLLGALRIMSQLRPEVAISLGSHAAFAPALAAVRQGAPLVIMEQNAIPGKVNRILSRWAREVYAPWQGMENQFNNPDRVHTTGNPVRGVFHRRKGKNLAAGFKLDPHKRTLLVMGGSQGAQAINRALIETLPLLEREASWLQVLHAAGQSGFEEVRAAYSRSSLTAAVYPFITEMTEAYCLADLALCRAGGTTLAELTTIGVPAVLVPLPSAANDHQRKNASLVAGSGAAFMVEQEDLAPERVYGVLMNLLKNEECLARAREAALRIGRPSAVKVVADRILNLISQSRAPEKPAPAMSSGA